MQAFIKKQVIDAYSQLGKWSRFADNEFPIVKLTLGVTGVDAYLLMDEIMADLVVGENSGTTCCNVLI